MLETGYFQEETLAADGNISCGSDLHTHTLRDREKVNSIVTCTEEKREPHGAEKCFLVTVKQYNICPLKSSGQHMWFSQPPPPF